MGLGSMMYRLNTDYVQPDICRPAFGMNGYNVLPPHMQAPFGSFGNAIPPYYNNYRTIGNTEFNGAFQQEVKRSAYLKGMRVGLLNGRYYPIEVLGRGTFGKVYKCHDVKSRSMVALKVINLQGKTTLDQTLIEIKALSDLNKYDKGNKHFVKMLDYFTIGYNQCIVFEILPCSLYDDLIATKGAGFGISKLRSVAFQLIVALAILGERKIVHCDLKPENIMLHSRTQAGIKVADLGSCCYEGHQIYTYIQSRFYRAPEVILELPYGPAIDVWSSGCLLAELSAGVPLFNGRNNQDQMARILEYMGPLPEFMVMESPKSSEFFAYSPVNKQIEFVNVKNTNFNGYYSKTISNFLLSNKFGELYEDKLLYNGFTGIDDSFENFVYSMLNLNPQARATPYDLMLHPFMYSIISLTFNSYDFPPRGSSNSKSETSRKRTSKNVIKLNSVEKKIIKNSVEYVTTYLQTMAAFSLYQRELPGTLLVPSCQNENCKFCRLPY